MKVDFYDTQLALLDRLVDQGKLGKDRQEVIRTVLKEHAASASAHGFVYSSGPALTRSMKLIFPRYGQKRLDYVLKPITGKALPVYKDEVLRIEQLKGGQCVDFNSFNLEDYKEQLSCGATRGIQGMNPRKGALIWTNAPRCRPMYLILDMPKSCAVDIAGHRCNRSTFELRWNMPSHPNCQDTLAEAIREYGLTPDDVHDSFNLWMNTVVDKNGMKYTCWNPAKRGDHVDLLALFDVLAVPAVCGSSDLTGMSNFKFEPIRLGIHKKSAETTRLCEMVNQTWGRLSARQEPKVFKLKTIPTSRRLKRVSGYEHEYIRRPQLKAVNVLFSTKEKRLLSNLLKRGIYGKSLGEATRIAFMYWWNKNRMVRGRPGYEFANS